MQTTQHEPKFRIEPAEDKDTEKILQARNAVLEGPFLSDGARAYFCWLLDAALNHDRWYYRGAVRASIAYLTTKLKRCKRSFNKWNKELADGGHIWISKLPGKNTHFFNLYHITALDAEKVGEFFPQDAMWGSGGNHPGFQAPAVRGSLGRFAKAVEGANFAPSPAVENGQNPPVLREYAPGNGANVPLAGANPAIGNGTNAPLPMAKFATANGKDVPLAMAPARACQRQGRALNKEAVVGDKGVKDTSKSIPKGLSQPLTPEERRMLRDMEVYTVKVAGESRGAMEIIKFTKQWVARYREDSEKFERLLADGKAAFKEGLIRDSFGAYLNRLWPQFASRKAVGK